MSEVDVVEEVPEGAEVAGDEPADASVDEVDLLKSAMRADREGAGDEGEAPRAAPTATQTRVEKAAAAERARVERRAVAFKLSEAEELLASAKARAEAIERAASERMRKAEEHETELQRVRRTIEEKGLDGLGELGYDYATIMAAEADRNDPQALAKKAAAEVAALRAELAERQRAEAARHQEQTIAAAVHRDRSALVEFAEQASDISPTVASVARAARTNHRAARILIEAADEIKDAYVARMGRLPYMHEVVAGLDEAFSFIQASGGSGQAPAPVSSQAARPRHQRTLGSPGATSRQTAAVRELTEDEIFEQQVAMLREAQARDRG